MTDFAVSRLAWRNPGDAVPASSRKRRRSPLGRRQTPARILRSGIEGLSEGQPVVVDVVEGRKGPEAARVRLI